MINDKTHKKLRGKSKEYKKEKEKKWLGKEINDLEQKKGKGKK